MGKHRKVDKPLWRQPFCVGLVASAITLTTVSVMRQQHDNPNVDRGIEDTMPILLPTVLASPTATPSELPSAPSDLDVEPQNRVEEAIGETGVTATGAATETSNRLKEQAESTTSPTGVATTSPKPTTTAPSQPPKAPPNPPPPSGDTCGTTGWGLQPAAAIVAHHVQNLFGVNSIGGYRKSAIDMNGHPSGLAIDFMVPVGSAKGDQIAAYLLANKAKMNVDYVIWKQRVNYGTGWKSMPDRGGVTENHFDHVHVNIRSGLASTVAGLLC